MSAHPPTASVEDLVELPRDLAPDLAQGLAQGLADGLGQGPAAQTKTATAEKVELRTPRRIEIDPENLRNGLGQLVLTLIKLLHELLEKQAIRRMESSTLTEAQVEQLGLTLMRQAEEIERLRDVFGLKEEDLNLDLGPLGKLL